MEFIIKELDDVQYEFDGKCLRHIITDSCKITEKKCDLAISPNDKKMLSILGLNKSSISNSR